MDLYLFGPPVGVTEFFLRRTYTYNRRIFIRDSHRSYRAYSVTGQNLFRFKSTRRYYRTRLETGLIQIQDLSYTELIRYRSTRRYYSTYSDTICHAPNPGPTRLAVPNRFPGRETQDWDSLPDFFFLKNRTGTCGYGPHLIT